jgi:hypothetical protein
LTWLMSRVGSVELMPKCSAEVAFTLSESGAVSPLLELRGRELGTASAILSVPTKKGATN